MNPWVLIIILVVILILFGGRRFPDIARGLIESIDNFKAGMRSMPRRQDGDSRSFWLLVLALIAVAGALSVLSLDVFSGEQKLALIVVLFGWIGAGYWAFGPTLRKRNDR
ncbi:MAG TPA: twin-arginine translocase TatA/TatE family subunit [Blastocatellia bacterium]|nr:twin-arginine translocase TatA/TatE family subunit [Blastocatellia bacterium]